MEFHGLLWFSCLNFNFITAELIIRVWMTSCFYSDGHSQSRSTANDKQMFCSLIDLRPIQYVSIYLSIIGKWVEFNWTGEITNLSWVSRVKTCSAGIVSRQIEWRLKCDAWMAGWVGGIGIGEHGGVAVEMNTSSLTILNNLLAASHCMSQHWVAECDSPPCYL